MTRRKAILFLLLIAVLVLTTGMSYGYLAIAKAAARTAQEGLDSCAKMAAEIEAFSRRPILAADSEGMAARLTGAIERAAKAAGIPPEGLFRIIPEPPQRIADTDYKEKPTQTLLKNVTLQQLTALLYNLTVAEQGLRAKSVRVTSPRPQDTDNLWSAEVVITIIIYDPLRSER